VWKVDRMMVHVAAAVAGTRLARPGRAARGWPLRRYLVGLVALFFLAAGAGIWSGWVQAERDGLSAARGDAQYGAGLAAGQIGLQVTAVRGAVGQVASAPGVARIFADPRECQLAFSSGGRGHLDVLRADGTVVCSSLPRSRRDPGSYAGAPWLPAALGAARTVAPVLDDRTGRPALMVTAPIAGRGAVAAFVDLPALGASVAAMAGGARGLELLLVTADSTRILTRWPDGGRWAGTSTGISAFSAPTAAGDGRDVTGLRRVYGRSTVDGQRWLVYAGAARAPALAAAHHLARRQAVVAGVGLLAGLAATFLVYRRITRPISRLRGAVRTAATGDPDATVAVGGPREVADLGAEFTTMMAAVDRELGERRCAEDTAREMERNYRQVFDASPCPMYVFDAGTLSIVEVNDAALAYYGHSRPALLAMTATGLAPPEDTAALTGAIAAAGPAERWRRQRQLKKDGTITEVTITSHLLSFSGRKARCAVIEDVTEREHFERRLRQSQRLESLGQLAGGIAHDFNNLLGIILGYAAMAAADVQTTAGDDPAWRALHDDLLQIVDAGDRATALTRQLLSFARADAIAEPQVLELNRVVVDIEKLLRRTLGEDIRLITRLTGTPWPVKADPGQLEQVLLNLAVNARDAMPAGGTLTIETSTSELDENYATQHPAVRAGRYMRLQVSDTGTGMSKATLERAFEPFFTTKPKGHGTGLGLATIYGIIATAGGHIQIYSEPGLGTTITVLLPATDETATQTTELPTQPGERGDGVTVLLVEDDENLRALTERVLARHGYTVLSAATAADAQHLAARRPRIELLLTDVVLPGTDGHTLATAVQAGHPTMNVIYMSGYTETILAARSTLPAGTTLLNKPVNPHHLLAAVARGVAPIPRSTTPR
jgi:PAS domain S-box-containing protein